MKGQKNEISTRPESRHSSRPDVFYFFATAHFLKQLPTHIAHIAKDTQANAITEALSKSAILPPLNKMNEIIRWIKQDINANKEIETLANNVQRVDSEIKFWYSSI